MVENIRQKVTGTRYLQKIILVLSMFKNRYQEVKEELNFVIIQWISTNKSHQLHLQYANFID